MNTQIFTQEVVNLHTHSYYCGHGFGEVEEYAQQALEQKLQVLGFSEHCPVPDDRWARTRMPNASLSPYSEDCLAVRDKYEGKLVVLRGFECDYLKQYHSYFTDYILGEMDCDYLLFGVHDLSLDKDEEYSMFWNKLGKKDLFTYTDQYLQAMQSGLFVFGAHPDVFAYNYRTWDKEAEACSKAIIECAVSCNVALEINANGMRKKKIETESGNRYAYPIFNFWDLAAKSQVKIICNSDAHKPEYVNDKYAECKEFADSCNITFASFQIARKATGGYNLSVV
ncbi:histidinol phosphate phosphatase HisJ family [Sphaerochaeta pleomorpha str. Grapes]|uniref:Histidinol-phosphatase n=1 Tax=Sphaerochaeta pleomorpha (strain ATCC BAA-1885 / DSM 22778 / Grapes) TaxID=158190 RepID=G8QTY5_SPHPG|nr:histidinol-phosphatase [Sphaerochaeta pleomorpha]AEV29161.1 histidinol phosphate phosphatase HisJ family [Sphaerochaeta pleomorpha str. Grapes]